MKPELDRVALMRELRTKMAARGWSAADVARVLDINAGTVRHWVSEVDEKLPSEQMCFLLAGHFDLDLLTHVRAAGLIGA